MPPPTLNAAARDGLRGCRKAAGAVNYVGAGTMSSSPTAGRVLHRDEHAAAGRTSVTNDYRVDLVEWQPRVAFGEALPLNRIRSS